MRGCTPRPAAVAPNSNPSGLRLVGDHQGPAEAARPGVPRGLRPARVGRIPRRPSTRSASKARRATPDSMIAIVSASSSRLLADEAAALHALQRDRLHRRRLLVGVEPDVAVEDPVGPGDRLVAKVDRLRAREPVREGREALLHLAWSAAGAVLDQQVAQGEARELLPQLGRHPARLGNGLLGPSAVFAGAPLGLAEQALDVVGELGLRELLCADLRERQDAARDRRRRPSGIRPPGRGR